MQVCLLGSGSIIGDMSLAEQARRSASVMALTDLVTFKVPITEFKRRMPEDVLEVRGVMVNTLSTGLLTQHTSKRWET